MKFCPEHWNALRDEVDRAGLSALIPDDGEAAMRAMVREMNEGSSVDSFDPLMIAHNLIWSRAMEDIKTRYQQNPLMLMADADEHPEWACPVCALIWCHAEHDRLCEKPNCNYPREFDWAAELIPGAVAFTLAEWRGLKGAGDE